MKTKNIKLTEYRLSILREEAEDRFYGEGWAENRLGLEVKPKHWNEYVGFDLTHEEVIEILALISRMRGVTHK